MADNSDDRIPPKTIDQVGIVVRDIDRVIEKWSALFGIDRWTFREMTGSDGEGRRHRVRLAFARLGPLEIELIQPVEGRVFHSVFLERHGEGLHHIGSYVADVIGETEKRQAKGARILSARPDFYAYLDSGQGDGVIFELINRREREPK